MEKRQELFLYFTVFVSGAAVLILEILGTRVIAPFYGATIFVWSSLITVTLGFLALGYLVGGRLVDRRPEAKLLYQVILISAVFVSLILKIDQPVLVFTDQFGLKYGPLVSSLMLFAPSFLFLGMVTPTAIRISTKKVKNSGQTAGRIFAISTLGSVIGALLSGFFLLPVFSLTQVFLGLAGVLAFISLIGLRQNLREPLIALFLFSLLLFPKVKNTPKGVLTFLDQRQSFYGDIKVTQHSNLTCLYVNGSGQTCIDQDGHTDGFFQRFLESEISNLVDENSRVLLLGLGGGGILEFLPPGVQVDIVEIDPVVAQVAQNYFSFKESPRQRLIIDDARHFLATTDSAEYDVIIENVSLGNSVPSYLLSQNSFIQMRQLLKPEGVLIAHLASHEVAGDNRFNEVVLATAGSVFEYTLPLSSQENQVANLVLYLSNTPINYQPRGEVKKVSLKATPDLLIATDNKNMFETYYQPIAISHRENIKPLGYEVFFVK